MDKPKSIIESVSNEIVDTSLDLGVEYAELTIDEIFDSAFQEVPIIKTLLAITKVGISIKERRFIKKLLVFLKEFHANKVNNNKLEEFKHNILNDVKYKEKVMEHIVVFIDSFLQVEKSKILARLFLAHISGAYDWKHFTYLSASLDSAHPAMFDFLQELSTCNFEIPQEYDKRIVHRDGNKEALINAAGLSYEESAWGATFKVSQLGQDLYNYGLKA
jgi:hypothetical protein